MDFSANQRPLEEYGGAPVLLPSYFLHFRFLFQLLAADVSLRNEKVPGLTGRKCEVQTVKYCDVKYRL